MSAKPHRNTIHVEEAEILAHHGHAAAQYVLRVHAPHCAAHAEPGSFAHLTCDPQLPLRRPLSIMRTDPAAGWVEFLYKAVGRGTGLLARRAPGERLSVMGPIGRPFALHAERRRPVLIGGGVGIPPMVFLADRLRRLPGYEPFAVLGSEVPFPFSARPSQMLVPGLPDGVIAAMPLLEDWGVPSRLTSLQGYPGCHEGYVTDLVRLWLHALPETELATVEFFACGPHPMLKAVTKLAAEFDIPAQISLEEYMACAVGGCAGCTVRIDTPDGPAMKRVCVDGPVFDAETVVF
jgi:dihydroorotate dehydrogenase electron transfer subunit